MATSARRAFAKRLKALRIAVGYIRRKDFSAALGQEDGTYGRWERAEAEPSIDNILRICQLLQVTPTFLLLGQTGEQADMIAAANRRLKRHN